MNRIQITLFCAVSLALTLVAIAALFPFSAMSLQEANAASTPQPLEAFDEVDLGEDFGIASIYDLVGYYIENPPVVEVTAGQPKKKHFGGC